MSSNSVIAKQVASELELMHDQLVTFKSNVAYLNDAKANINSAVKALNDTEAKLIHEIRQIEIAIETVNILKNSSNELAQKIEGIDFPDRLQRIEDTVKGTIKEMEASRKVTARNLEVLVNQVSDVDFLGNFTKLQVVVATSAKSNAKIVDAIEKQDFARRLERFQNAIALQLKNNSDTLDGTIKKNNENTLKLVNDLNLPIRIDKLDLNISGILTGVMTAINKVDNLEKDNRELLKQLSEQLIQQNKINRTFHILMLSASFLIGLGSALGFYLLWIMK